MGLKFFYITEVCSCCADLLKCSPVGLHCIRPMSQMKGALPKYCIVRFLGGMLWVA